jgi:hypothetical protein
MKRLSEDVKRRIVEHLACYQTHSAVSELISQEFGINVPPRHVRAYDPGSFQFAGAHRWIEYHKLVRERYAREVGKVAIAHRIHRLRRLSDLHDDLFERALSSDTVAETIAFSVEARAVLEQAAKEVGNWFVR